ncbi:processed acidic surface protein [Geobacillus subterraneus]|uniref:processed acidic surface protein n=1 Tax=Geobacillus subterraneus TaxID=129338 RepID=UPI001442BB56|nr:processed acidic surface protein [Geobacillus subterraneus]QIZ68004.1 processed acidic surface protein [Geobacillus subterraneus]
MKKVLPFALAASVAAASWPASAFAIERNDPALAQYLDEVNLTVEELENYLDYEGYTLDDFDGVDELRSELGEPLTEENLAQLLAKYGLTEEQLRQMLIDNGEIEADDAITDAFIFSDDLKEYIEFFKDYSIPITDETLADFLNERGMTKEELMALLSRHGESVNDYGSIGELSDMVDYYESLTPLTDETLNEFLQEIGMTKPQLEKLLARNDDSLDHYTTIEELSEAVVDYLLPDLDELGLTEAELEKLYSHFESLNMEDPQFAEKMEGIGRRLEAIGAYDFASITELSPAQIAEIADVWNDLLAAFQLEAKFYLTKDGEKKPLSLSALLAMESANGYDLLVEIYSTEGGLLADVVMNEEMFASDIFDEIGEDLQDAGQAAKIEKVVKPAPPKPLKRTEAGAKLPKTASPYATHMLFGLALIAAGAFLARFRRETEAN